MTVLVRRTLFLNVNPCSWGHIAGHIAGAWVSTLSEAMSFVFIFKMEIFQLAGFFFPKEIVFIFLWKLPINYEKASNSRFSEIINFSLVRFFRCEHILYKCFNKSCYALHKGIGNYCSAFSLSGCESFESDLTVLETLGKFPHPLTIF